MSCGGSCEEAGEAAVRLLAGMVLLCVARNALALVCLPPRRVRSRGGRRGLPGRVPRRSLEGAPSSHPGPRSALKRPSSAGQGTGPAAAAGAAPAPGKPPGHHQPPHQQQQQHRRRRETVPLAAGGRRAKPLAPRSPDGGEEEGEGGAAVLLRWLGAPVAVLEAGRAATEEEEARTKRRPPPAPPRSGSLPPGPELLLVAEAEKGLRAPGPLLLLRARAPPDPASAGKVVYDAQWVHCVVGGRQGAEPPRESPRRNPREGRTARFSQ